MSTREHMIKKIQSRDGRPLDDLKEPAHSGEEMQYIRHYGFLIDNRVNLGWCRNFRAQNP